MSKEPRKTRFIEDDIFEVGIDEAGRGPLFGRVYSAAVVLPNAENFDHSLMKDSKRFTSEKKINEAAQYIKNNAVAWAIGYIDETIIDKINIRQATFKAMHKAIKEVYEKLSTSCDNMRLLVDGNDFKTYMVMSNNNYMPIKHTCIEGGDNKYSCISAASILAKVARDEYINELCCQHENLKNHYGINKNKGYGTKQHLDGIKAHGITKWHRKSYGICKQYCN